MSTSVSTTTSSKQAEAGKQIVVTGNPGDGKTHLIERLRPKLEALGARVITDANACTDDEILEQWVASRDDGKPFVLAINEWPLYVLQRLASKNGFTPVAEALRQAPTARFFVEVHRPADAAENVVVVDPSLRNLLAASVVERVIDRLNAGPLLRWASTPPTRRSRIARRCASRRCATA